MLDQDESAGFEWLDLPFALTRIVISLLGALCAFILLYVVIEALPSFSPPPPQQPSDGAEESVVVRTPPAKSRAAIRLVGFALLALPVAGSALVWRRPRRGFLLAGLSWVPVALVGVLDGLFHPEGSRWSGLILLLPLLWLVFAWWKVGPDPRPAS
jgi:hypothetical protein